MISIDTYISMKGVKDLLFANITTFLLDVLY